MNPNEIGRSYDSIAHVWRESRIQSNGISQVERAIQFTTTRKYALDIGCGCSGRFIDLLIRHGFQPEGIDVSERMIALARQRHPDISFYHADICRWSIPRKYDFILAWDSIWHVPLDMQEPVMQKICEGLSEGGVFIFTTGGLDEPEEKRDSCMGPPVYYSALGIPKTLELLRKFGCVCRHLEYDQYPEKHLYIIAQRT
ncbi:MAG: class I SAM-dependent methyltransferase [Chthoniobacteraceae bacterium]|jgi:SAM-dependent methyltransferase